MIMHASPRPARHRARRLLALPAVIGAAAALTSSRVAALPPPQVTPAPVVGELAASAGQQAVLRASAAAVAARLGLDGTAGPVVRAADPTTGRLADSVELRAADGHLTAVVEHDTAGRLVEVVDLAVGTAFDRPLLDATAAPATARRLAMLAGLIPPPAMPTTTWDDGMDAWCVRWTRTVDGVPAPTDGLVTWVHRDGRLKAISSFDTPLAASARGGPTIAATAATAAVQTYVHDAHLDGLSGGVAYAAPQLAWILPNGFVDGAMSDAQAALRLAWVVRFSYVPRGWRAGDRHLVELDVDAATGALIGGTETA